MRPTLGILLLISSASLLSASTINTGSFTSITDYGGNNFSFNVFSGPDISIRLDHRSPAPFCVGAPGSTCDVSFSQNFNIVADLTFSPQTPSATVVYGGTTYNVNLGPGIPPNTSFVLNLRFTGPTSPVALGAGCPGCSVFGSTNGIPFTMTGTATLTVGGTVIFSNLALSGSGLAGYSVAHHPTPLDGTSIMSFTFAQADIPEPSTYATAALGLAGLAVRSLLRRQSNLEKAR